MSTIAPGELNDIETSVAPLTELQANAEALTRRIWKRIPTYQSGVETTTIGPPTSGTHVEDEHWIDALGGEWVCTAAGTPGTWKQHRPAVAEGEPADASIPVGYLIWDVDDGFTVKSHAGSAMWMEEQEIYRTANDKATTHPVEYPLFIQSDDSSNPLQLRFGLRTHATAGSRYAAIDVDDGGTPRHLAIQPSGGLTIFGTTSDTVTPAATVHIVGTTAQFRIGYSASQHWTMTVANDGGLTFAAAGTDADLNIDLTGATDGDFTLTGSGGSVIFDSSTGRLGIKTTAPTDLIQVGLTIDTTDNYINISTGGGNARGILFTRSGNTDASIVEESSEDLEITYDQSDLGGREMRIQIGSAKSGVVECNSNGNVKIYNSLEIDADLNHDGSNIGVFGTAPTTKQTVSGAKGGNAALGSLLTALAAYGLITNSTTA